MSLVYLISDTLNGVIRDVNNAGVINTAAITGLSGGFFPIGLTQDSAGNVYVVDQGNNIVWKINLTSLVATRFAGNGTTTFAAGAATSSGLNTPQQITCDAAGNVYVSLIGSYVIVAINTQATTQTLFNVSIAAGNIAIIAGTLNSAGNTGLGGQATSAKLVDPQGLAIDSSGNLFIGDYDGERICQVTPAGIITKVVGTGSIGYSGDGGPATSAKLNAVQGLCIDPTTGVLVFADYGNYAIRAANLTGSSQTLFGVTIANGNIDRLVGAPPSGGVGTVGYSGDGGAARSALIASPEGIAISAGRLYFSDGGDMCVRAVTSSGTISSVAGFPPGNDGYTGDGGPATAALLWSPRGILFLPGTALASVTPSNLTFTAQKIGTISAAQTVTITNIGTANLILASPPLALTGTDAIDFGIAAGTTATPGLSIPPGGSCFVKVVLNPAAPGILTANLVVTDNSGGTPGATQIVALSGTGAVASGTLSERNFACNGCFESSSAYGDVLKSLALSMAGFVVPPGDCWRVYAGSYVPPQITLQDGDCRGSIKGDFRLSSRDTCNGVKGQYIPAFLPINPLGPLASSPASPAWKKTDFPPVQRHNYIAEDGGVILWKDIQLDFTISLWMAQRIARIVLERLRRQVTISVPAKLTGLAALAADTINFLHARWSTVNPPVPSVFQISHTALRMESQADGVPAFGVDLMLRQTDAAIYSFAPPTSPTDFGDYSGYGQTGIGAGNVQ